MLENFNFIHLINLRLNLNLYFGQFLNLIKNNLQLSVRNDSSNTEGHKLHYYSAHDTTLNGILMSLGLIDEKTHVWPPFAADITVELWKEESNHYFIRFYYCGKVNILIFIFKIRPHFIILSNF